MPIRVVLADDHAMVREGLAMILGCEQDISVLGQAADGREALRLVEETSPDVVIIDISMPGLNGVDAARYIRTHHAGTEVLVLSMHVTTEHISRALQAGAKGNLIKESAGRELVKAIRAVCAGERYLSSRVTDLLATSYARTSAPEAEEDVLDRLSEREREVLQLVVEGKSSKEIARSLDLSQKTVETYRSRIMQKLDIRDIPSLVKFAIQQGITSVE